MNIRTYVFPFLIAALLCLATFAGPAVAATPFQNLNSYSRLIQPGSGSTPAVPVPSPVLADVLPSDPFSRRTLSISTILSNIQPYEPSNDLSQQNLLSILSMLSNISPYVPSDDSPQFIHSSRNQNTNQVSRYDPFNHPVNPSGGCGG